MESNIYQSYPLETGKIRLLTLNPGPMFNPITCDLVKQSLDAKPKFEALSYTWEDTWEDPTLNTSIRLCGQDWPIGTNLGLALKHLRDEKKPRILWVDALCINQASSLERSYQVAQMATIYETATRVVAWLGEGRSWRFTMVNIIEEIAKKPTAHWNGYRRRLEHAIKKYYGRGWSVSAWDWEYCFNEIISCQWWERVWTLQEAVLPQELVFMIGVVYIPCESLKTMWESWLRHSSDECCCCDLKNRILSIGMKNVQKLMATRDEWRKIRALDVRVLRRQGSLLESETRLASTASIEDSYLNARQALFVKYGQLREQYDALIKKYENFLRIARPNGDAAEYYRGVDSEFFMMRDKLRDQHLDIREASDELVRKLFAKAGEGPLLENHLHLVWTDTLCLMGEWHFRKCSDQRDEIYGYSGLRSLLFRQFPIVDYSFPSYKVWEDFQLDVIRRSKCLDVLSLLGSKNAERDVSWLISYIGAKTTLLFDFDGLLTRKRLGRLSWFQASGQNTSKVQFISPCALSVRGFHVSRVSRVGLIHHIFFGDKHNWFTYKKWWGSLQGASDQLDKLMTVYCEILMCNSSKDLEVVVKNANYFKALLLRYIDDENSWKENSKTKFELHLNQLWSKLPSMFQQSSSKYTSELPSASDMLELATRATANRQLIVSDTGHVGLGPEGVNKGDLICILFGGKLPLILRSAEKDPEKHAEYGDRLLYKIVGDSYIHGLVHGEAMEYLKDGRASEMDFLLI